MSHFTSINTKIRDLSLLRTAATILGLEEISDNTIRAWDKETQKVDVTFKTGNRYNIGVVKETDGTYALVADWWGVGKINGRNADQALIQEYAVQGVLRQAKLLGHQVTKELQKDGSIRLTVKTG